MTDFEEITESEIRMVKEMLKIGICDMDEAFVYQLQKLLEQVLYQYADWEAQIYKDSAQVIEDIKTGEFDCNLLFLDIFQKSGDGTDIAKLVSERNVDVDLIFVTASDQHVFECYKYHTFAYVLKPLQMDDLSQEISRYLKQRKTNPKCLNISNYGLMTKIPIDTIYYIESRYRKIVVHTAKKSYEYYERLDHLEEILAKDGFIRCHQSYLVAEDKITAYKDDIIQLGTFSVPVSRRYKDTIRDRVSHMALCSSGEDVPYDQMNQDVMQYRNGSGDEEESYITSGLFQYNDMKGALICVKGAYLGKIVRFVAGERIVIGRDEKNSDMIVNLPMVSRQHCTITYIEAENVYEITDQSTNGTFVDGTHRLVRGDTYRIKPGAIISFGDKNTIYRFG